MKIGVLTSSRADFGIYLPLLKALDSDTYFNVSIIAFGTHLSRYHGYTANQITDNDFVISYSIESILLGDTPEANATSTALTSLKFSSFWNIHKDDFDLVLCLGDRFEMFAAVMSGVPFGIKFAHIHGGETTLGAIDNIYRHAISLASTVHFTSTDKYAERVRSLVDLKEHVYSVGALSLDNLEKVKLLTVNEFFNKWKIDLSNPTVLITYHPETVAHSEVSQHALLLVNAINYLNTDYQVLITMPNADTSGSYIRQVIIDNFSNKKNIYLVENLGTESYFSALKMCSFVFGNSSSGLIESASFERYAINIGNRQEGRMASKNVINVQYDLTEIDNAVQYIKKFNYKFIGENVYYKPAIALTIKNILKTI